MPATQTTTQTSTNGAATAGEGKVHSIGIAGLKVVKSPDKIRTVLGSCIGITLFDRVAKVGGMAHIMLPSSQEGSGDPKKFADTGVELLLEAVLADGAIKDRLRAKIAGGAAMFGPDLNSGLGNRNALAVKEMLTKMQIPLMAESVGGTKGRKMQLDPATGDVLVEAIGEAAQTI